jgi:polysaccharide deacetylase family protein (PEP-CTERM system associated)
VRKLIRNALTVDLEDWFHPEYIASEVDSENAIPMIEQSYEKTLNLLSELQIRSTFFVNGQIAERFPEIIREIEKQGHEIASHGYTHTPLWRMSPELFAQEVSQSNTMIKKATGKLPIGFRAPSFSLSNETIWALKILKKAGYLYDSSVFPVKTPLYGVRGAPLRPYRVSLEDVTEEQENGDFIEFPPLAISFLGIRVPTPGGFYFRITPASLVRHAIAKVNSLGYPAMLYFHPWELLEETPRVRLSIFRRFVSYFKLSRTEKQIRSIARVFRFAPVRDILNL